MATFILIPGAGGNAFYWSLVVPMLEQAGHVAVAVDLPGDDAAAGLPEYVDLTLRAIGAHERVILVAQSLGGFTAAMTGARAAHKLGMLVLVNAMIPLPGETAGAYWGHVDTDGAQLAAAEEHGYAKEFSVETYFLHDVPEEVFRAPGADPRPEADIVFSQPCAFERWPALPLHVLAGADDRFFPLALQERVARERLGLPIDAISGGHLVALSNPHGVAEKLLTYQRSLV
ncbi:MAG: alpha/beta fold hydrolase [Polyangiales bacterium]